jgi:hypothetical protein
MNIRHLIYHVSQVQQDVEQLYPAPVDSRMEREIRPLNPFQDAQKYQTL